MAGLGHLSDDHLERRYDKIVAMRKADPERLKPNPLGPGFLTRDERYCELLLLIEREWWKRRTEATA